MPTAMGSCRGAGPRSREEADTGRGRRAPILGKGGPWTWFPPCPEAAALSQGLFLGSVEKVATMQALEWAAGAGDRKSVV